MHIGILFLKYHNVSVCSKDSRKNVQTLFKANVFGKITNLALLRHKSKS
jgi:hypothetical protein